MNAEALARQIAHIERALAVFHPAGDVVELRALGVQGRRAVCEIYGDMNLLAARAAELDGLGATGTYFTLNPLRPDLAGSKASCRKADVILRRWLPLDIDPYRPKDTSATEAELQAAWVVLDRCRGQLVNLSGAVIGRSGNGWHLCYPVELPNDDQSQELLKATLKGLHARCGDHPDEALQAALKAGVPLETPQAKVEEDVHDAPRIWKLYGTRARKGLHTPERPHRWTKLIEGEHWQQETAQANTRALHRLLEGWRFAEDTRRGRPQTSPATYAQAAMRQELAAIAGATVGDRNNQLNRSAFALGTLVGSGALSRPEVEAALAAAAQAAGLGEAEAGATIRSGIEAGLAQPRDLSAIGTVPSANGRGRHPPRLSIEPAPPPAEPRAVPFPLEVFPPWLRQFCLEGARSLCCPVDYLTVPLLVAAGSAIGASRALELTGDWWVMPALYACVVAPPGSAKSPAAARSLSAIRRQQQRNYAGFRAAKKRYDEAESDQRGDKPVYPRAYTSDVTTEKLVGLLQENPRGLLYHRDELLSWIGSMDQYRDGGKGADRQIYMAMWDHTGISIERKCHDDGLPICAHRPCLSVYGTIQPDVVHRLTREGEADGFLERILFSYAEPIDERAWHWNAISADARRAWDETARRLYSLAMTAPLDEGDDPWPRFLRFDSVGASAWERWYAAHQRLRADLPTALHATHAKLESYAARFALLVELLWYASGEDFDPEGTPDVSGAAVDSAALLVSYFLAHARRARGCLELTPADRKAEQAAEWLRRRGGSASAREFLQSRVTGAKTASAVAKLLEDLADRGLGTVTLERNPGNGKDVVRFTLAIPAQTSADPAPTGQSARFDQSPQGVTFSADSADASRGDTQ